MGFVKKSDVITTVDKLTPVSDSVGIIITKADGTTPSMTLNTQDEKIESESGAPSAELALDGLTDVDVATATDGQALVFDEVSGKWMAETVETAVALAELTDVTIGTPQNGNALIYNSTTSRWENIALPTTNSNTATTGVTSFTSGSGTWTVPAGVYNIDICAIGGGASGGKGGSSYPAAGGAGATVSLSVRVVPGQSISYIVGTGGAGRTSEGYGNPGGNSLVSLTGVFSITANGGVSDGLPSGSSNTVGYYTNYQTSKASGNGGFITEGGSGFYTYWSYSSGIGGFSKGGDSTRGQGSLGGAGNENTNNSIPPTGYGAGSGYSYSTNTFNGTAGLVEFRYTKNNI